MTNGESMDKSRIYTPDDVAKLQAQLAEEATMFPLGLQRTQLYTSLPEATAPPERSAPAYRPAVRAPSPIAPATNPRLKPVAETKFANTASSVTPRAPRPDQPHREQAPRRRRHLSGPARVAVGLVATIGVAVPGGAYWLDRTSEPLVAGSLPNTVAKAEPSALATASALPESSMSLISSPSASELSTVPPSLDPTLSPSTAQTEITPTVAVPPVPTEVPTVTPSMDSSFTIATMNFKGASHVGDAKSRTQYNATYIVDHHIDVGGTQEDEKPQRDVLESALPPRYDFWPRAEVTDDVGKRISNTLYYDSDVFEFLDGGFIGDAQYQADGFSGTPEYFDGNLLTPPWVLLKYKTTGQKVVIINTHEPADVNGPAAQSRDHNANLYVPFITSLHKKGIAVYFVGDVNSTEDFIRPGMDSPFVSKVAQLPLSIIKDGTKMMNVCQILAGPDKTCPSVADSGDRIVDIILGDEGTGVTSYTRDNEPMSKGITDHPYMYATIDIPPDFEPKDSADKGATQ